MSPSHDVDELAAALLDGLLDAGQAAAARRDPAVTTRVDEMRAAREALRQVPPPDPRRRDDAIAAALGAAGGTAQPTGRPDAGPPPAPSREVVPLAGRRRGRWADPRWLGAAAAVALVLAVGGLLAVGSTGDGGETATVEETADAQDDGTAESGAGEAGGSDAAEADEGGDADAAAPRDASPGAGAPGDGSDLSAEESSGNRVVDLGSADSPDDLARRARSAVEAEARVDTRGGEDTTADAPAVTSACADPLSGTDAGRLVLRGRATLEGRAVEVWVHDDEASRRLVATDSSCTVVADRLVPG